MADLTLVVQGLAVELHLAAELTSMVISGRSVRFTEDYFTALFRYPFTSFSHFKPLIIPAEAADKTTGSRP